MNDLLTLFNELDLKKLHIRMLEDECQMQFLKSNDAEIASCELEMLKEELQDVRDLIAEELGKDEVLN